MSRVVGPIREPGTRDGLTKSQAEARLRRIIEDTAAAPPIVERVTVKEAGDRLLAQLAALGRKRATVQSYESILRVHLAPHFGDQALAKITRQDVEAFIGACRADGQSVKSTLNYLGLLHGIFEYTLREGWVSSNPCKLAAKPRAADVDPDIHYLDPDELEALIRAVPADDLGRVERVMYFTAATTGMRQGELLALRWSDVDWPARRVRVRRNFVRGEYGTPKSKRSSRAVPLADPVAGQLDQLHQASDYSGDDDLVFAHPHTGKPIDRSKLLKRFKAALRLAGVREVRFHDLRHTFGTRMAAHGVPMRALQEMMGHRDFKTTLIYADYAPSAMESEWAEAAFGAAVTNPVTNLSGSEPN
ncbi:MAG: site-specific integrase [Thermoleophilaceae bacterium]|nr:site-specific integrase [Thermoleophilaceae bacterium]